MTDDQVRAALTGVLGSDAIEALIDTADGIGTCQLVTRGGLSVTLTSSTDLTDPDRFALHIEPA